MENFIVTVKKQNTKTNPEKELKGLQLRKGGAGHMCEYILLFGCSERAN